MDYKTWFNEQNQLIEMINANNRREAIEFSLTLLNNGKLTVCDFYEYVITPIMRELDGYKGSHEYILMEHLRSAIVRSIIEMVSYQFGAHQKLSSSSPVVVLYAPAEEYHELGLRMAQDIFEQNGCRVIYPGPNFPKEELLVVIKKYNPCALVMSVTAPYNLVAGHKACMYLQENLRETKYKIFCAGAAFQNLDSEALSLETLKAHIESIIYTLHDIENICKNL